MPTRKELTTGPNYVPLRAYPIPPERILTIGNPAENSLAVYRVLSSQNARTRGKVLVLNAGHAMMMESFGIPIPENARYVATVDGSDSPDQRLAAIDIVSLYNAYRRSDPVKAARLLEVALAQARQTSVDGFSSMLESRLASDRQRDNTSLIEIGDFASGVEEYEVPALDALLKAVKANRPVFLADKPTITAEDDGIDYSPNEYVGQFITKMEEWTTASKAAQLRWLAAKEALAKKTQAQSDSGQEEQ